MEMIKSMISKVSLMILALILGMTTFAQEGGGGADVNVDINKGGDGGGWYTSPWVWIVGGAVFILLLVALLRGSGSRRD